MHRAEIVGGSVIVEMPAVPVAAVIAFIAVTVSVINPAIKADMLAPIAVVENIAVVPAPIRRSSQQASVRRLNPGTGHPIIAH
ncbi:hypothetical protein GCM10010909_00680 [Acidocella aquatica]|uniref:Uncharacterized protein n=1 Tax=Acidocella aquatica TaxID=1922313 RepID=A0ABQ6A5M0_9PROT|nr:hypothetical protein GCM10010909_00680 [Acidocella aquatica]